MTELEQRLLNEAQAHAMSAKTYKTIVHTIYQSLDITLGDWNGAVPVVEKFKTLKSNLEEIKLKVEVLHVVLSVLSASNNMSGEDLIAMLEGIESRIKNNLIKEH